MIPWELLGRTRAPDGGELTLHRRDREFVIRVDGRELMSSRAYHSEAEMARVAVERLSSDQGATKAGARKLRMLVGGLGMGFTARAALDALPRTAELVVAEIVPAVIEWNRGPLGPLAGRPLDDPRLTIVEADVGRVMATTKTRFDAILLDVDNGPQGLTRKANQVLYTDTGLANARRALQPGGLLAVWSAADDRAFERRLGRSGFDTDLVRVPARDGAGGTIHTIFFGRLPAMAPRPSPLPLPRRAN
jgi:spermidine synthase